MKRKLSLFHRLHSVSRIACRSRMGFDRQKILSRCGRCAGLILFFQCKPVTRLFSLSLQGILRIADQSRLSHMQKIITRHLAHSRQIVLQSRGEIFPQRQNFKRKNINVKFLYFLFNLCNFVFKKSIYNKKNNLFLI